MLRRAGAREFLRVQLRLGELGGHPLQQRGHQGPPGRHVVAPAGLDVEGDVRLPRQQKLLEALSGGHVDVVGTPGPEPELRELHVERQGPQLGDRGVVLACPLVLDGAPFRY